MRRDIAEERTRDAIAKTAQTLREASARNGTPLSQTEAEKRVREARLRGDRNRNA